MPPDEPNDEERLEELPEDNGTPFQPADPTPTPGIADTDTDGQAQASHLDDTHPDTDSGSDIDSQELYDEGLSGATESEEPNAGNAVTGYDPDAGNKG